MHYANFFIFKILFENYICYSFFDFIKETVCCDSSSLYLCAADGMPLVSDLFYRNLKWFKFSLHNFNWTQRNCKFSIYGRKTFPCMVLVG